MRDDRPDGPDASPDVSVIVPTRDRAALLTRLLDSLAAQDAPAHGVSFEVVVVDDASSDGTHDLLVQRAATQPWLRTLPPSPDRGASAARNRGVAAAAGDLIAFTDDDCVADPSWLRTLTEPLRQGRADVAQGRTTPGPRPTPVRGWTRTIHIGAWTDLFETCNIAYRRGLLDEASGFDTGFVNGEDTDLGHRVTAAGARTCFVDDAVVTHHTWELTLSDLLRYVGRMHVVAPLLQRHPHLRAQLWNRVFWTRRHAVTLAALVVVPSSAVVGRWVPAAALAVWVLVAARPFREGPPIRRLQLASGRVLADVWEVAATLRGSLRARTVLL